MTTSATFNLEDAGQIIIGAAILAVPIAFSEEAWRMGETLAWTNIALVTAISLLFLLLFAYQSIFQGDVQSRVSTLIARVVIAYTITFLVVALIIFALDKFPLTTDPATALRRAVVITLPASMGGIIVDSFDKE